jgi:hypothetical protein
MLIELRISVNCTRVHVLCYSTSGNGRIAGAALFQQVCLPEKSMKSHSFCNQGQQISPSVNFHFMCQSLSGSKANDIVILLDSEVSESEILLVSNVTVSVSQEAAQKFWYSGSKVAD